MTVEEITDEMNSFWESVNRASKRAKALVRSLDRTRDEAKRYAVITRQNGDLVTAFPGVPGG